MTMALEERVRIGAQAIADRRRADTAASGDQADAEPFGDSAADALAVIVALDARPPQPRASGPLNGGDADALRVELGTDSVVVIAQDRDGRAAVAVSILDAGSATLDRSHARRVTDGVFTLLVRRAASEADALVRRAAAFVGTLVRVDPREPGDTMLVQIECPRWEYDAVVHGLGTPQRRPSVAFLACESPVHPLGDDDVLDLAVARRLATRIEGGEARLRPALLHELGRIVTAFGTAPPSHP